MRQHTETVSLRYLAPPAALIGFAGGLIAGVAGYLPAFVLPGGYLVLICAGSLVTGRGRTMAARARLPIAYATMHASWGLGFLLSPRSLR